MNVNSSWPPVLNSNLSSSHRRAIAVSGRISSEFYLNVIVTFCSLIGRLGPSDLCKNIRCHHGARCEDGVCVCPTQCPTPVDASSSLCANDGRTYATQCHMQKAACDHGLDLQMIHTGPCASTAADLILAPFDSATASLDDQSPLTHPNRKCNCNHHGKADICINFKIKKKKWSKILNKKKMMPLWGIIQFALN